MLRLIVLALLLFTPSNSLAQQVNPPRFQEQKIAQNAQIAQNAENDIKDFAKKSIITSIAMLIFFTLIYITICLIPFLIAVIRNHPNKIPILLTTILFGCTGIGWQIALIWSFTNPPNLKPNPNPINFSFNLSWIFSPKSYKLKPTNPKSLSQEDESYLNKTEKIVIGCTAIGIVIIIIVFFVFIMRR